MLAKPAAAALRPADNLDRLCGERLQREDAGEVRFKHWGVNQNDVVVFEGERRVLIKRRSQWSGR